MLHRFLLKSLILQRMLLSWGVFWEVHGIHVRLFLTAFTVKFLSNLFQRVDLITLKLQIVFLWFAGVTIVEKLVLQVWTKPFLVTCAWKKIGLLWVRLCLLNMAKLQKGWISTFSFSLFEFVVEVLFFDHLSKAYLLFLLVGIGTLLNFLNFLDNSAVSTFGFLK